MKKIKALLERAGRMIDSIPDEIFFYIMGIVTGISLAEIFHAL